MVSLFGILNIMKNISSIIDKISTLVGIYATSHNLKEYVTKEICAVSEPYAEQFDIFKINFKSLMKKSSDIEVIKFVETINGLVSDTERETLFIEKFYPDYLVIYNSLQKIIYELPKEASEDDFIELNKLYKKYAVIENDTSS